jgi:hypothetical protein
MIAKPAFHTSISLAESSPDFRTALVFVTASVLLICGA